MKKTVLLAIGIMLLSACAGVDVKQEDPMALWGADAKIFDGRVYSASSRDRNEAIRRIAKIANQQGFNYFTLMQDGAHVEKTKAAIFAPTGSNIGNMALGASRPVYRFYIVAFFLYDNELNGWKNVYEVKKYL